MPQLCLKIKCLDVPRTPALQPGAVTADSWLRAGAETHSEECWGVPQHSKILQHLFSVLLQNASWLIPESHRVPVWLVLLLKACLLFRSCSARYEAS